YKGNYGFAVFIGAISGLAIAHVRLGQVLERESKSEAARKKYEQAVALDPNEPRVLVALASLSGKQGYMDEAIDLLKRAEFIDPLSSTYPGGIGHFQILAGRLDEAEKETKKAIDLSPKVFPWQFNLAIIHFLRGQYQNALEIVLPLEEIQHKEFALTVIYQELGMMDESDAAMTRLAAFKNIGVPLLLADAYAYRGETDKAFEWLNKTLASYSQVKYSPFLKNLHEDPRWNEVLERLQRDATRGELSD
ncbi:MAG: tetratricopeptide repeat protein, partial [Woeseia sp.]